MSALVAQAGARGLLAELLRRQALLAWFGLTLLALALPTTLAALLDARQYGAVSVWTKPLKFQLSVGLFALTAAWFVGYLPEARRRAHLLRALVWILLITGGFEVAYITLQGGLGEASHFNVGSPLHAALFSLMGLGAVLLTGTAAPLAWLLARHGDPRLAPAFRLALVLGLALTALLGIVSGGAIATNGGYRVGGLAGDPGLPLLGWSTSGGDLRVAHFLGVHAQQLLPLAGAALAAWWPRWALAGVAVATLCYLALTLALLALALEGRSPF